jgi:sulfoxide reductase heme-binding subunit YedZ
MLPASLPPSTLKRVKAALFIVALFPLTRLFVLGFSDGLGANPIEFVIRSNGTWALSFLLMTLAVTPLRRLTGASWLAALRRMLGLYVFFYACLHVMSYVWLDQWFDWNAIGKDIVKHPFILAGLTAFILLIPLAITSSNTMMRRLGKRWKMLHQAIYLIAPVSVLHYFWLVKKDITQPAIYALLLALLLGLRLLWKMLDQHGRSSKVWIKSPLIR